MLAVAFAVRLAWAIGLPTTAESVDRLPDQREYLSLGRGLLADGSLGFVDPRFGQRLRAYRTPGYPLLVAACGGSVRAVRVVQAGIDTGTVWAVYLIARRLCGTGVPPVTRGSRRRRGFPVVGVADEALYDAGVADSPRAGRPCHDVAIVAAAVVAVDPFYVYFCGLVLSETVFTALLAWGVYLLLRGKPWAAAALLVAAAYVRPSGLLIAPVVAAAAGAHHWRRAARHAIIVSGCLVAGLLPWAWRNQRVLGHWVWTTTNAGATLYDGFHAGATGASDQRFLNDLPAGVPMTEVGRSAWLSEAARRWAVAHPADVLVLTAKKVARGWSPVPLSAEFGRPAYRWLSGAFAVPFDVMCLVGLCSRRLRWPAKWVLVAPAVAVTVAQVLSVGSIRYRIPAEGPLAVLAAVGLCSFNSRRA